MAHSHRVVCAVVLLALLCAESPWTRRPLLASSSGDIALPSLGRGPKQVPYGAAATIPAAPSSTAGTTTGAGTTTAVPPPTTHVPTPIPARVKYVKRHGHTYTLSRTRRTATKDRTSTKSPSLSPSFPRTQTFTRTRTPPPTPTRTRTFSYTDSRTMTEERTVTETQTLTISPTPWDTATRSLSLIITMTKEITLTAGITGTSILTTSAIPPTTSEQLTRSPTLRTSCPDCVHGYCKAGTVFCQCFNDGRFGHWAGGDAGAACTICQPGYYGSQCMLTCPGSPCDACHGHGKCSDGVSGTGQCTCYKDSTHGWWASTACDECASGWYGLDCKSQCPCTSSGSHGTCDDGLFGTGQCACNSGWSGTACNVCNATLVANCPSCPNSCSGHGSCVAQGSGFTGNCVCDDFYATTDCSVGCPNECSGVGVCFNGTTGNGTCSCPVGFLAPSCDACIDGLWADNCSLPCDCSNNGKCNRVDGSCECYDGYVGSKCQVHCNTGSNGLVCSGHGTCYGAGLCSCSRDATSGYWGGMSCSSCATGYGGATCKIACPVDLSGNICGGSSHGICNVTDGTCSCLSNACGTACDGAIDSNTGLCSPCPSPNLYGKLCTGVCNCSSHGTCNHGMYGDGSCACDSGWAGVRCDTQCPGGASNPCFGNGVCKVATAMCECYAGYATANCSVPCINCTHGTCNDGASGNGLCTCDDGWSFPDTGCTTRCDCGSHGACNKNFQCICDYQWSGAGCVNCAAGWAGDACTVGCRGTTNGHQCVCASGYAGPNCATKCNVDIYGNICSKNGVCDEGWYKTGACMCFTGYVGPTCECSTSKCSQGGLRACLTNGTCACLPTRAGADCLDCASGYWGTNCDSTCDCSGHGECLRSTGVCVCYDDAVNGYWTGSSCSSCVDGYFGDTCTFINSPINTLTPLQTRYVQGNSTTGLFLLLSPSTTQGKVLLAGTTAFAASFDPAQSATVIRNAYSAPVTAAGTVNQLCSTGVSDAWYIGTLTYVFAQRGSCNDVYQLFVSQSSSYDVNPLALSSISDLGLPSTAGAAVMFQYTPPSGPGSATVQTPVTTLCYATTASGSVVLRCIGLTSSNTVGSTSSTTLTTFATVTAADYSATLQLVFLGGLNSNGDCVVAGFAFDPVGFSVSTTAQHVAVPKLCIAVGCVRSVLSSTVLVGSSTSIGVAFTSYDTLTQATSHATFSYLSSVCSDITFQDSTSMGMVAFKQREHSVVLKLRTSVTADASKSTVVVPFGAETLGAGAAIALEMDPDTRVVFGLALSSVGIVIFRWLLVDAVSIEPQLVDLRAGTLVTVTGAGFYSSSNAQCLFGGTDVGYGVVTSSTTLVCTAPAAIIATGCGLQSIEISMNGWAFTSDDIQIQRVPIPSVYYALPSVVYLDSPNTPAIVSVFGFNFVSAQSPHCIFTDGVTTVKTPARHVDGALMLCNLTATQVQPLYANSTVDVAMDGEQWTGSGVAVSLVGSPVGIVCTPSIITNLSAPTTSFTQHVSVTLVDAVGNQVVETKHKLAKAVDAVAIKGDTLLQTSAQFDTINGVASLIAPDLNFPVTGSFTFVTTFSPWTTNFTLVITQGTLSYIEISQQPPSSVFAGERLANNTVVTLHDASGNLWIPATATVVSCVMVDVNGGTLQHFPDQTVSLGGDAVFDRLEIDTSLGVQLRLKFWIAAIATITPVISNYIRVNCLVTQFQYTDPHSGLLSCRSCAAGMQCNGSAVVIIQPGYWMGNLTAPVVYACPIDGACPGGVSVCNDGYTGPLCAVCSDNYGLNQDGQCQSCGADWVAPLVVSLTVSVMIMAAIIFSLILIQFYDATPNVMVVVVCFANFGQTLAVFKYLDAGWPRALKYVYDWAAVLTNFEMHTVSSDCLLRKGARSFLDVCIFYFGAMLILPVIVIVVRFVLQFFPMLFTKESRRARIQAETSLGNTMEQHRTIPILAVTAQLYLFMTFQSTVTYALRLFVCRQVVDGGDSLDLLTADLSVSCHSSGYLAMLNTSYAVSAFYGVIVPLGQMVGTMFVLSKFKTMRKEGNSKIYLPLILLGLRPEVWYWNSFVLARKFLLCFVVIINSSPLNSFLALWVLNGYALLVWIVRPYANEAHNLIELMTSFATVMVVNTSLLNMAASSWVGLQYLVTVLVILFVVAVCVLMLLNTYTPLQRVIVGYIYKDVIRANLQTLKRRADGHGLDDDANEEALVDIMAQVEKESNDSEGERMAQELIERAREAHLLSLRIEEEAEAERRAEEAKQRRAAVVAKTGIKAWESDSDDDANGDAFTRGVPARLPASWTNRRR